MEVLPLYANLPPEAQIRIFGKKKPNTRRIIVATNIAETSITIPGVVFVIDTGYKKEKEYIFRTSGGELLTAEGPRTESYSYRALGQEDHQSSCCLAKNRSSRSRKGWRVLSVVHRSDLWQGFCSFRRARDTTDKSGFSHLTAYSNGSGSFRVRIHR